MTARTTNAVYRGILIACSVTVSDDHAMLLAFVVTKAEGTPVELALG